MLGYNLQCETQQDIMELICFNKQSQPADDLLSIYNMQESEDLFSWDRQHILTSQDDEKCTPASPLQVSPGLVQTSEASENQSSLQADHTFKHTATTRDSEHLIHDVLPKRAPKIPRRAGLAEREIFLHSKLKIREPRRRSVDLGDLRSHKNRQGYLFGSEAVDLLFEQPSLDSECSINLDFCIDKDQTNKIYNDAVDSGRITQAQLSELKQVELQVLERMFWLRLTGVKAISAKQSTNLLSNIQFLNNHLSKSVNSKKRTEEQLKKQFKTVLKAMHDKFKQEKEANSTSKKVLIEAKSKEMFLEFYFGTEKSAFSNLFKCVQLSRDFYAKMFSYPLFRSDFSACCESFMAQFWEERTVKTNNLISAISHEMISNTKSTAALRTPWSTAEAQAADIQMRRLLAQE